MPHDDAVARCDGRHDSKSIDTRLKAPNADNDSDRRGRAGGTGE